MTTAFQDSVISIIVNMLNFVVGSAGANLETYLKFGSSDVLFIGITTVYDILAVMGVGMLIIYFLFDMNKNVFMNGQNVTYQTIMTPLLKLGAGYFLISKGKEIIGWFFSFCNWWVDRCVAVDLSTPTGSALIDTTDVENILKSVVAELGLFPLLILVLITVLFYLVSLIIQLVFIYKALAWKIEIAFRTAVAPISFGDIYDGKGGNAFRYLKKILSMVLYAGGMILVVKFGHLLYFSLFDSLMDSLIESGLGLSAGAGIGGIGGAVVAMTSPLVASITVVVIFSLLALVVPLVELGAIKAVKQICDDVVA